MLKNRHQERRNAKGCQSNDAQQRSQQDNARALTGTNRIVVACGYRGHMQSCLTECQFSPYPHPISPMCVAHVAVAMNA